MLYLTTKCVFEQLLDCPPKLRLCFLKTNRHGLRIDCGERCVITSFYISAPCIATVAAMEKLYPQWAADRVFFYELGHMLQIVENAWFTHSRVLNKNVKSSDGGIPTLQNNLIQYSHCQVVQLC